MRSFAHKEHWSGVYQKNYALINRISNASFFQSYYHVALFALIKKYIQNNCKSIFEVGCAPGNYLIKFHKILNLEPYGVDYEQEGYSKTRKNFVQYGLNPENIFLADFFQAGFLQEQSERYDIVFSAGFIEHFPDPQKVVAQQMSLVAPGGYLICLIPNVRYGNALLTRQEIIDIHNQKIMDCTSYRALFEPAGVVLYCNYFGGMLNFGLYNPKSPVIKVLQMSFYLVQRILLDTVQKILFFLFRKDIVWKFTSPSLLCIVKKYETSNS